MLVAPGAGGGAPECFYPTLRRIEIDATYIAGTPDVADPRRAGHKKIVPTGYGLLVHGAAHAVHSQWVAPPGTPPILAEVAETLEESRAEGRQRSRRRTDRRWLRHMINIVVHPGIAPIDDPWHAGVLAALLLARVDARILTSKDVRGIRTAVTAVVGRPKLRRLREIWRQAHTVDDTDATTVIGLARNWCEILGIDPGRHPLVPVPDAGMFADRLDQALIDLLAAIVGLPPGDYRAQLLNRRHSPPADWGRTAPTTEQLAAARHLAGRIARARTRNPEVIRRGAVLPPGRLRTRDAIAADAQIAAGHPPTAQPWKHRTAAAETQLASRRPGRPVRLHDGVCGRAVVRGVDLRARRPPRPRCHHHHRLRPRHHRAGAAAQPPQSGGSATDRRRHVHLLRRRETSRPVTRPAPRPRPAPARRRLRRLARRPTRSPETDLHLVPGRLRVAAVEPHGVGGGVLWLHPEGLSSHTFENTTTITVADPVDAVTRIADAAVTAIENA